MGMRLLLRSNHLVSDAVRLFCGPAPQQRNSARGRGAMSNRRVDGAADHRMLRSMAATISNSPPGQPLSRDIRAAACGTLALSKCERLSGRPEPMRFRGAG